MRVDEILAKAKAAQRIISTAESCTGGVLSAALTAVAGASEVFDRGFVTYSNVAKVDLLGVSMITIERDGAVSEAVAREMADGAQRNSNAHIAISITGVAGPGSSNQKPEGRVCFGLSDVSERSTLSETIDFGPLGRDQVRKAACEHALEMLLNRLNR
ncbi:MAG: CinA family protein [Aestuariivita sp.]|nr:CinA family protein [Aestuariivita sp.]MCY4201793.1 CinA family protein [Aestuariivita sp.]